MQMCPSHWSMSNKSIFDAISHVFKGFFSKISSTFHNLKLSVQHLLNEQISHGRHWGQGSNYIYRKKKYSNALLQYNQQLSQQLRRLHLDYVDKLGNLSFPPTTMVQSSVFLFILNNLAIFISSSGETDRCKVKRDTAIYRRCLTLQSRHLLSWLASSCRQNVKFNIFKSNYP